MLERRRLLGFGFHSRQTMRGEDGFSIKLWALSGRV
jgi:hypothetical protein